MKSIRNLTLMLLAVSLLVSCEKEPKLVQQHVDLELMDAWQEFEAGLNEEIIFKIDVTGYSKVDLSWKEEPFKKDIDTYTGDVIVSAYRPDGITPYFENQDNGFSEDAVMLEIPEGDTQLIIIVKAHEGKEGTFAIRARGVSDLQVTNPKDLALSTDWTEKNINEGDVKWLKVDCGTDTDITVEWLEWDRPTEETSVHTADIQVAVYSEDLATIYVDNKNHGYGDSARAFTLTHGTSIIYIRVTLYDSAKPGTWAIRAYPTPVL